MTTTKLKLPELTASQSQKHITHNEALFFLDNIVQLSVIDRDLATPPGTPALGDTYLVGAAPTGSWTGKTNQIASYDGSGWIFFVPSEGWKTWVNDEDLFLVWDGTAWSTFGGGGGGITVKDEGTDLTTALASLNFVGAGVTASNTGGAVTVTISGSAGSSFADNVFEVTDNVDPTKKAALQVSGVTTATTRALTVPDANGTIALLDGGAQTFSTTTTFSAATNTLGSSTGNSTANVGSGATGSGNTKTLNLGTAGVSGSTTVVNLGSAVAGALGSLIVNSPTVTFASSVTAIGAAAANVSALFMGLGGATADATNRLSINTPAVLLNNAGTSIDMTFNKNAAANDASMSFKTGFSSRALIGLLGDDNFTLKVSPDGSSFFNGLTVIRSTGKVRADLALNLNPAAGDLAAPVDGDMWYNSTLGKFRGRQAGTSVDLVGAGGGGGLSDGDYGDIIVSGSGTVLTIDPAVHYGQNLALNQNAFIH